ncbi:MAG: DNA sulfur modification protein DndB [Rhodospirillales bacterium]
MVPIMTSNVKLHKFKTLEDAQLEASKASVNVSGIAFPVVMFRQGNRLFLNGALPISYARQRLHRMSAKKKTGVAEARHTMNRPWDPTHSRTIAKYLAENRNKNFIIPPLTLNIQQAVDVYTIDVESDMKPAYVVVPMTAVLSITDGQHREAALEELPSLLTAEEMQTMDANAVAVMIVCESDIDQIHQDFADCSKTKPLPPSQLAVFDRRNPANGLVLDLIDACPLFKDKVDATSSSLSKGSISLFLANQVRQLVKELLVGSYAEPDVSFEEKAKKLLVARGEPKYNEMKERFFDFINVVTNAIPVLRTIASLNSLQLNKIPELRREGWICMTASGMNVIGRIGHDLFRDNHQNWRQIAARLGDVDWSKAAPIWSGNLVQPGTGKIMTQQTPLKAAAFVVRQKIGLAQPAVAA